MPHPGFKPERRRPQTLPADRDDRRIEPEPNKKKRRRFAATPFLRKHVTPNQSAFQGGSGRAAGRVEDFPGDRFPWHWERLGYYKRRAKRNTRPETARQAACPSWPGRGNDAARHKNVGRATIWSLERNFLTVPAPGRRNRRGSARCGRPPGVYAPGGFSVGRAAMGTAGKGPAAFTPAEPVPAGTVVKGYGAATV